MVGEERKKEKGKKQNKGRQKAEGKSKTRKAKGKKLYWNRLCFFILPFSFSLLPFCLAFPLSLLQLHQHLPRDFLQRFEHPGALEGYGLEHGFFSFAQVVAQRVHR